jgi:hypothetical protein
MAKIDIKTFFTKIVNVFPKDMYLVHNWCAIAGDESDGENRGFYICILDSEIRTLLNKTFPNHPTLYIKNIRETKTDMSKIQEILDEKILKNIDSIVESHMSKLNSVTYWDTFHFTEEEKTALFSDGDSLELFKNDKYKSPIIISKSLFPLITEKTIDNVRYSYNNDEDENGLNQIIMVYDFDFFQLVMRYMYLKI